MDESYWEDPQVFKPERFIENGTLKKYERMIPFGKGKRIKTKRNCSLKFIN